MPTLRRIVLYLQRAISRPDQELSRAQRRLRFAFDLTRHCFHELRHDQASQMAAALTYRTIFSLVPIVLLSLLVFQTSDMFKDKREDLQNRVFQFFGLDALTITTTTSAPPGGHLPGTFPSSRPAESQPGEENASDPPHTRQVSIDKLVNRLTSKFSKTDVGKISVIGLVVLIWGALALLVTVEQTFNRVYDCPSGRAWYIRIPAYWAVITLGPVLLSVSIYIAGVLTDKASANLGPLAVVLEQLSRLTALASSWLLLFLMYRLLPNTRVGTKPAAIGSLVAATLWELGKWGFKVYVARAVTVSQIYGALGLIPLFLLWVYITWIIVLFGLELSYTLQAMKGMEFKHEAYSRHRQVIVDPAWVLPVMSEVAGSFALGRPVSPVEISRRLGLPLRAVVHLTERLAAEGLLVRVQAERGSDSEAGYSLARPPENVLVTQMLDVGRRLTAVTAETGGNAGFAYLNKLDDVERRAAGVETLATLMSR